MMENPDELFDSRASITPAEEPIRIPRSAPPFPIGSTEERHRDLIRQGYTLARGKTGAVVFKYG